MESIQPCFSAWLNWHSPSVGATLTCHTLQGILCRFHLVIRKLKQHMWMRRVSWRFRQWVLVDGNQKSGKLTSWGRLVVKIPLCTMGFHDMLGEFFRLVVEISIIYDRFPYIQTVGTGLGISGCPSSQYWMEPYFGAAGGWIYFPWGSAFWRP